MRRNEDDVRAARYWLAESAHVYDERNARLYCADNMVRAPDLDRESKIAFAREKLREADIWEKHQRIGTLKRIDGNKAASDLRLMANRILELLDESP